MNVLIFNLIGFLIFCFSVTFIFEFVYWLRTGKGFLFDFSANDNRNNENKEIMEENNYEKNNENI